MSNELYQKIEELYVRATQDLYTPLQLAKTLEAMANEAWNAVDQLLNQDKN
jgi:hypothetical protein